MTLDCICILSVELEYLVELLLLRVKAAFSFNDKAPSPGLHRPSVNHCSCRSLSWRAVMLDESQEPRCQRWWFLCTSLLVIISPSVASQGCVISSKLNNLTLFVSQRTRTVLAEERSKPPVYQLFRAQTWALLSFFWGWDWDARGGYWRQVGVVTTRGRNRMDRVPSTSINSTLWPKFKHGRLSEEIGANIQIILWGY